MAKYLIFDALLLENSAVEVPDVDSPEAAVASVPSTTSLPERAVIVKRSDLTRARIVPPGENPPLVIERTV